MAGVRILDLTASIGGAFATRLLADLGADVVAFEAADRLRSEPGEWRDISAWSSFLGASKRSVALPGGVPALTRLVGAADAVLSDYRGGALDAAEQQAVDAAVAARPDLVSVRLSPFGESGPYRDWQATEIVEWALGGYMYFGGTADREPLLLPGHQAQLQGGMQAAVAIMAGLHRVRRTGAGQQVEVADWDAVLSAHWRLSIMWSHTGEVWKRLEPDAIDYLPCLDGQVYIQPDGRYNESFWELIEAPELAGDPRWSTVRAGYANKELVWAELRKWTSRNTTADVVRLAQARRVAATAVNTVADVLASEQFLDRDPIVRLPEADGTVIRLPAAPYKMSGSDLGPYTVAAAAGADTAAALSGELWPPRARAVPAEPGPSTAALDGLRVLELGANWAGPMITRSLGDLGAQVVKVEGARRPATRASHYPGNEGGKYHYNRSGYFNKINRNKLGVSLDITTEDGRDVFLELAKWADVFVENQSPQVLKRLRITYDDLRAVNPRLIVVCVSGFGLTGPEALYAAYGTNIEASGGLSSLFGYEPGTMLRTGSFYADPLAGSLGTIALLAALRQREITGEGQLIDLALQETMLAFFGADVTAVLAGQPSAGIRGNRDAYWAPQGCYSCAGHDMWVVISVRTDRDWAALCAVIERPDLGGRADLATDAGRRAAHDEIDAAITEWTSGQDHYEAARSLQAAGVPAAPVLKNYELLADVHLQQREFYRSIPHVDTGAQIYPGFPWKFAGTPARVYRPAPRFAEHNDYVFTELLGMAAERIDQLHRDGITDTVPG